MASCILFNKILSRVLSFQFFFNERTETISSFYIIKNFNSWWVTILSVCQSHSQSSLNIYFIFYLLLYLLKYFYCIWRNWQQVVPSLISITSSLNIWKLISMTLSQICLLRFWMFLFSKWIHQNCVVLHDHRCLEGVNCNWIS